MSKGHIAVGLGLLLLLSFPLYHHLAVPADALRWGPPSVWGPNAKGLGDRTFSFGEATQVDQGVSLLLQHARTRRLTVSEGDRLEIKGHCGEVVCTFELRMLTTVDAVESEGGWHWVTLAPGSGWQSVPISEQVLKQGVVQVQLVRSQATRDRDQGAPEATLHLDGLEFR